MGLSKIEIIFRFDTQLLFDCRFEGACHCCSNYDTPIFLVFSSYFGVVGCAPSGCVCVSVTVCAYVSVSVCVRLVRETERAREKEKTKFVLNKNINRYNFIKGANIYKLT